MAYASKYYDPQKAHEYYMKTRELKGYENRYGGARGNGTSLASGGSINAIRSGQKSEPTAQEKHNNSIKSQIANRRAEGQNQIKSAGSAEERYNARRQMNDDIQRLRQQTKGGSTSGFNQKGKEAAAYIKEQMKKEQEEVTKAANKAADNEMLGKVRSLSEDFKAAREAGFSTGGKKKFASRIKSLLGETKKAKMKAARKRKAEYKQKYKDEIDKLREDDSMFSYYDKRAEQDKKRAERAERSSGRGSRRRSSGGSGSSKTGKLRSTKKSSKKSSIQVPDTVVRGSDKIWRKK